MKRLPSQQYLRECFDYCADTGALVWRTRPQKHFAHITKGYAELVCRSMNARFSGKAAGTFHPIDKYRKVCFINTGPIAAHRIIWKWMTGQEPAEIDHRDNDRTNNRWANLREATRRQNNRNRGNSLNRIGHLKGATKQTRSANYMARIKIESGTVYLGSYRTEEEAHLAYCAAARRHFGEFFNPG